LLATKQSCMGNMEGKAAYFLYLPSNRCTSSCWRGTLKSRSLFHSPPLAWQTSDPSAFDNINAI